jgi:hypothetical protein
MAREEEVEIPDGEVEHGPGIFDIEGHTHPLQR